MPRKLSYRTRNHYASHGQNASYCVEHRDDDSLTEVSFRRGRVDEGEAVQVSINVSKFHPKRTVQMFGHLALSQEVWDKIVEFVTENREIPFPTSQERRSTKL